MIDEPVTKQEYSFIVNVVVDIMMLTFMYIQIQKFSFVFKLVK